MLTLSMKIVTMVTTDHTNAADTDTHESDEWKPLTLHAEQAFESARLLKYFIFVYHTFQARFCTAWMRLHLDAQAWQLKTRNKRA
jgi:hypothetical protein